MNPLCSARRIPVVDNPRDIVIAYRYRIRRIAIAIAGIRLTDFRPTTYLTGYLSPSYLMSSTTSYSVILEPCI